MDEKLARYLEEEVKALTEENRQLRAAAQMFGQLAERLNRQLQAERDARHTAKAAATNRK
jgi:hypothetical protein